MDEDFDPLPPEMPVGFDDDGRPVPVTEPVCGCDGDPPEDEGENEDGGAPTDFTLPETLDFLLLGTASASAVGERALVFGYVCNTSKVPVPRAPRTLRELAGRLGVSHVAAGDRVNKFRAIFQQELAHYLEHHLNKLRLGNERKARNECD